MSKSSNIAMFVLGAAVGSLVAWYFTKKKQEEITREEIDSVKEVFSKLHKTAEDESTEKSEEDPRDVAERAKDKPDILEYTERLKERGYVNYSDYPSAAKENVAIEIEEEADDEEEEQPMDNERPYIIEPERFGEYDDYKRISFSYFADKVVADENDELVDDVDEVIGLDSLTHFGEYEDDSIFVRNASLKSDYEVLIDHRKYSDVVKSKPYLVED
ncbi:MAG: YtxH domain-containing protein [Clostridia bacterium]